MPLRELNNLTICGLDEIEALRTRDITHVLSIIDPTEPDPVAFRRFPAHQRLTLRFHDVIHDDAGAAMPPTPSHVEQILAFGRELDGLKHLLVHCHAGVSRSTAAMTMILAQAMPDEAETDIVERIVSIRPQAWPNSLMIAYADAILKRDGRLTDAVSRLYGRRLLSDPAIGRAMAMWKRSREVESGLTAIAAAEDSPKS